MLKHCHTSAQNVLNSKHGCKGKLLLDMGKTKFLLVLFCADHQTFAMKRQS